MTATLRLYDTATREKTAFAPIDPKNVRLYVCGPTVYDRAHIGNARPVIVFDLLYRLLRHHYGAAHVTYVRNITDVDDKIIARARATAAPGEDLNAAIQRVTRTTTEWFHEDAAALGALPPDHEPRATDHVAGMIAMAEGLIAAGAAYAAEGHVLFDVSAFESYGALSRRAVEDMVAGARV
ncbi:MAG: cysteine--tRNA ligase, partial [Pseudomonadota bacterium]